MTLGTDVRHASQYEWLPPNEGSGYADVVRHHTVELRGLEPRTEPGEMALELRFLSFGVVTRVLRFLRICVGVLRDVTVLDRLVWRPTARG